MIVLTEADPEKQRLFVSLAGCVHIGDLEEMLLTSAKERRLHFELMLDATEVSLDFQPSDANRFLDLAQHLAREFQLGKTAVLVSDDAVAGLAHMFGLLIAGICPVRAFKDAADAEQWLGWGPATPRVP